MKAAETLIAWTGPKGTDLVPPFGLAVGRLLLRGGEPDWTEGYLMTGGAADVSRRSLRGGAQTNKVLRDWWALVHGYGLDPYAVHVAFLRIDEYLRFCKTEGWGPGKDEWGHDPTVSYGRVATRVPSLCARWRGGAFHVWPAGVFGDRR